MLAGALAGATWRKFLLNIPPLSKPFGQSLCVYIVENGNFLTNVDTVYPIYLYDLNTSPLNAADCKIEIMRVTAPSR